MNRIRTQSRFRILLAAGIGCFALASPFTSVMAQPTATAPLFDQNAVLQITLEAPLRALRRDDARSNPERAALVRHTDPEGVEITLDVDVRVRGNSRLELCRFPPLRLDFRRRQVENTVFAGQNRLKLVTLCRPSDTYRDYLYLEHDIYRLYATLTDYAFKVRRVDVRYVSTDARREEAFTEPAFFIEADEAIAERHAAESFDEQSFDLAQLNLRHTALLSVFQYVIGNTDWSPLRSAADEDCCHNGKPIGVEGDGVFVIPYDFDQSGLVDTQYAQPAANIPIRSVRQRHYRGYCPLNPELDSIFALFIQRRDALESVLVSSEAGEDARLDALSYLQESLDILTDTQMRSEEILLACR